MGWRYHVSINSDKINYYEYAFVHLLDQCIINIERLKQKLSHDKCYRFLIKTNEENDKIICDNGEVFLKSKFLSNNNFKRRLIDYYKSNDIFVKGPKEIITGKCWIIELVSLYNNRRVDNRRLDNRRVDNRHVDNKR
jgi:hypothetical protein